MKRSQRVEERKSNTMYEGLSIQRKASKKVDGKIYETLYGRKDNVKECSEVKAIGLYENPSGSEY